MAESEYRDRKEYLVEELWQLIQDSKALVEETMRLAAESDKVRRKILAENTRRKREPRDQGEST